MAMTHPINQTSRCINGVELPNTNKFLITTITIIQLSKRDLESANLFLNEKFSKKNRTKYPENTANIIIQIRKSAPWVKKLLLSLLAERSIIRSNPNKSRREITKQIQFNIGMTFVHFLLIVGSWAGAGTAAEGVIG